MRTFSSIRHLVTFLFLLGCLKLPAFAEDPSAVSSSSVDPPSANSSSANSSSANPSSAKPSSGDAPTSAPSPAPSSSVGSALEPAKAKELLEQLAKKLQGLKTYRYKLSEAYTPTGVSTTDAVGASIPNSERIEAEVLVSGKRIRSDFRIEEKATGSVFTGFYRNDGKFQWTHASAPGTTTGYVTKQPLGFAEELTSSFSKLRPEFSSAAKSNCRSDEFYFRPDYGSMTLPHELYDTLERKSVSFLGKDKVGQELTYHFRLNTDEGCRAAEVWIAENGLPKKLIAFNPFAGFQENIEIEQLVTGFDPSPKFQESDFVYDERHSKHTIVDMEKRRMEMQQMMTNTFATPPEQMFVELFKPDPKSVKNLQGVGILWTSYEYALRFEADSFPDWHKPMNFVEGDIDQQLTFFLRAFPNDATNLIEKSGLIEESIFSASESHDGKDHVWLLHNRPAKTYFVRAWGDE